MRLRWGLLPAWLAVVAVAAGCASRRRGAPAESIDAADFHLPHDARPGMFVAWTTERASAEPDDEREHTLACVSADDASVTMEERRTLVDGTSRVTALRFRRDGTLERAWKGTPGGEGLAVGIRDVRTDWREVASEADALRRSVGLPPPSVDTSQSVETIETPAGRIRCVRRDVGVSLLFASGGSRTWHALDPLPLSSLVRCELTMPGFRETTLLRAYGYSGAAATLRVPADPAAR